MNRKEQIQACKEALKLSSVEEIKAFTDGVMWADAHPKEDGVEMWVARDNTIYQDCNLHLFIKEPILEEIDKCEWKSKDYTPKLHLNSKLFPEVTFENSPMKVRLTLVKG